VDTRSEVEASPGRRSISGLARFAWAHGLASAGDALVTISLAGSLFFSLSPDASRRQVLLYLAITMVPFSVLAPLIGPTIDRFSRGHRALAVVCYVTRGVAAASLAFFLHDLPFYFIALVILVVAKASGVIKQALVRQTGGRFSERDLGFERFEDFLRDAERKGYVSLRVIPGTRDNKEVVPRDAPNRFTG
jgi:MFS family permease